MQSVANKTFIITGGASGLGEACTRAFLQQKANVAIFDVNDDGEKLAKELDPEGKSVLFVKTDVTNEESAKNAIAQAKSKFKTINGLVNCAGVGAAQRTATARAPHDFELFKKVLDINLNGTFNIARLAAYEMIQQQPINGERGVIINTASVAAYEGQTGQVAYAASKGAIVSMTIVMARDLAQHGIRVCTIAPGIFDTPLMKRLPDENRKKLESSVPFPKRFGQPEEFAHLALHIAQNHYFNGETIRLDGSIRMAAM